jgi:ribosomal protein L37AE/L43A
VCTHCGSGSVHTVGVGVRVCTHCGSGSACMYTLWEWECTHCGSVGVGWDKHEYVRCLKLSSEFINFHQGSA